MNGKETTTKIMNQNYTDKQLRVSHLIKAVRSEIAESMHQALSDGRKRVLRLVNCTDDIQVDVEIEGEDASVCVFNRRNLERYYPNIEERIINTLPHWNEIDSDTDEWDDHGFANEADYARWRYGA